MTLDKQFNDINVILANKNLVPLTGEEKELIRVGWIRAFDEWQHTPKATNHQFALENQIRWVFSNVVYDVLHLTRDY